MTVAAAGYAVDRLTPARHVASELARVAPAALAFSDLTASYMHPNTGDLSRVREHERCDDPAAWLVGQALDALERNGKAGRVQVERDGEEFRLLVPFEDLRFGGKKLAALHDDHALLRAPFDPMTGRFAGNVRKNTGKDSMDGLRESMREFGWIEQLPAIKDERGVVLMGHRRLAVAAELGIEPVISTVRFGDGDAADAKRFRLAVASNLDAKPFTREERQNIAEYLYGEREWTMARIGQALNVSQKTISKDLTGFIPPVTTPRPKGGRPKQQRKQDDPRAHEVIRERIEAERPVDAEGLSRQLGLGKGTIQLAEAAVRAKMEVEAEPVLGQMLALMSRLADLATVVQIRQAADDRVAALGGESWKQ